MNTARYVIGVALMMALPPGILLWFAIHPFARFWRRIGAGWTYLLLSPGVIGWMVVSFVRREALLGADLGTQLYLLAPAVACLVTGIVITVKRRRQLSSRIVAGLPELSRQKHRGKLITTGIYARIRHPRYVEVMLFTAGYAFFANYVGLYVATVLSVPALYLVVVLEERELSDRFGLEYEEYGRHVPRFFPLRGSSKGLK
jgi:protein-S-isoprenylcysteine O-methyltransferase Ste14